MNEWWVSSLERVGVSADRTIALFSLFYLLLEVSDVRILRQVEDNGDKLSRAMTYTAITENDPIWNALIDM